MCVLRNLSLFILLSVGSSAFGQDLPHGFPKTDRSKTNINQGWKFHLGDPDAEFYTSDLNDSDWETISVPHTFKLTSLTLDGLEDDKTQLIFHRNVGWYRRNIEVVGSDKKVFLEFEGVHQVTDVWVNGRYAGKHSTGGYTPFHFDITAFVKPGSNQVTVLADNRRNEVVPPDPGPFDYVKFSGLYRDVYLVETNPVHITFNWESLNSGVNITTPTIDPVNKNATINVKIAVKNEGSQIASTQLVTRIIDREGVVVARMVDPMELQAGQEYQFNQITSLEDNVHFWGIDDPYLYRVNSVVVADSKELDFVETKIGLRKFELDPVQGFILNNEPIELIGMNRHQQYPYVGDAVPNSLHYKDMLQFKEFGFNMMRTAHYPQDNALIDACDALGILVYEEAPTWISISQNEEWWNNVDNAARAMIRNHRNHPSIVMWGAGVNHRGYVPQIHNTVKQEDPTRLTASQGARWTGWQASGLTDINANMLYGPFLWDRSEPIFAMEGGSGPKAVAPHKRDPMMTGLISWTAHAYYTFHPTHNKATSTFDRTRSGMMTIFRQPRPQYEWYKAELKSEPFLFIENDWIANTENLTIFSNAPEVELFINGKSMGKQKPSADTVYLGLDYPPFHFNNVKYEDGKLVAKAYFEDGYVLEAVRETPGNPYKIELTLDTDGRSFVADGSDILMAYAKVVDKNGTTISDATNLIKFSVKGDASVLGDEMDINANPMFPEYGVAPALIRAGNSATEITVYASSKGLKSGSAAVKLVSFSADELAKASLPIYDFKSERVDIGAMDQLGQFGWKYWNGADNKAVSYTFELLKGVEARLEKGSEEGVNRWLGEMNVIGKYGFAYGDGVIAIDDQGLNLVLDNLPKGQYKLSTWHHAPRSNSDSMDPNKEKLKTLTVHQLPYEREITLSSPNLIGDKEQTIAVTDGGEMQWKQPGIMTVIFESDGSNPVKLNFNGKEGKGIWLNALELSEWNSVLDAK